MALTTEPSLLREAFGRWLVGGLTRDRLARRVGYNMLWFVCCLQALISLGVLLGQACFRP